MKENTCLRIQERGKESIHCAQRALAFQKPRAGKEASSIGRSFLIVQGAGGWVVGKSRCAHAMR